MKNIPGTEFPLKVYERKGPPVLTDANAGKRRKLLAIVHIAKKEMCLKPDEYEMILSSFKVASSGDMTLTQLDNLIRYLKRLGWKPKKRVKGLGSRGKENPEQIKKLRERVTAEASGMGLQEKRLAGLIKKIGGADALEWCTDPGKLRRLLKVLGKIKGGLGSRERRKP